MLSPTPLINLHGFEAAAADVLPRMVYDYYAGGANDELLLGAARTAWNDLTLRYRVLRDVSERSQRTEVLGHTLDWPVFVAPMAFQQLAHADGEVATAQAAEQTGAGMILSTLSNRTIEAVRAGTTGPLWFQLYWQGDAARTQRLAERGYNQSLLIARPLARALGLPIDPVALRRQRAGPPQSRLSTGARASNVDRAFIATRPHHEPVLLVDDVMTTGSILKACTEALLEAGAKEVNCLVFARADADSRSQ